MRATAAMGLTLSTFLARTAAAQPADLVPPSERGPYNVGTTLFTATMSGGRVARVQAFYPTRAAPDPSGTYTIVAPTGSYRVRTIYGAAADAVAEPGAFPLLVWDHGGGGAGGDPMRVSQLPVHELLATHGVVTVIAPHSGDRTARARDLPLLIEVALGRSATPGDLLYGSIDPGRVGIGGHSAGGDTAINVAAGWSGLPADARVRAVILYEPGFVAPEADVTAIAVPYLLMRGTQLERFSAGGSTQETYDAMFASTTLATPRVQVIAPNAVHQSFTTGICGTIDQAREQALTSNPSLPEPLTTLTSTNFAANTAYVQWNAGQLQYANSGPGFGGGRNICLRVGTASVRSLDADRDGETDSPPFMAVDPPYTPVEAPREEIMIDLIAHYTVAFTKVYLAGDGRYMRFLTPGYARVHALPGAVTIAE